MDAGLFDTLAPLVVLIVLFCIQVPVAFALAISGMLGIYLFSDFAEASSSLVAIPFTRASTYTLTVVPMFMLVGVLVNRSAVLEGAFEVAQRLTRRLPGGLAIATVLAATFLGGITGSSVADAATVGRVAITEMSKRGYAKTYAAAVVASAATVAVLLPTSIALAVFGVVTGTSVGKLLLAGIIPALMTALAYTCVIITSATRGAEFGRVDRTDLGLATSSGLKFHEWYSLLAGSLLFVIIIGGLYTGMFTPTEAGATAAFFALLLSSLFILIRAPSRKLRVLVGTLVECFREVGSFTAMIFAIVIGATIFSHFLVLAEVPSAITDWVLHQKFPHYVVVLVFLAVLIPLGSFVDGLSMLLIVAPLTFPTVSALGYDGVWYGVLFVKLIEIGLLHPPLGLNIYVVCSIFPDLPPERVFLRIIPFLLAEFVVIGIIFIFPATVRLLPGS